MARIVIALYDKLSDAQQAVLALGNSGFKRSDINLISNAQEGGVSEAQSAKEGELFGSLTHSGVPDDEAKLYAEGVRRGCSLLILTTDEDRSQEAADIMGNFDVIDIDERAKIWSEGGETEVRPTAQAGTRVGDEAHIDVVEEELEVGKRQTQGPGVRVRKHVTETPVEEEVHLREERVDVERRPVDRPLRGDETDAFEEKEYEFTETREEPVVGKRARVIEEIIISKDVSERTETVRDTVRRTDAEVEKTSGAGATRTQPSSFQNYDRDFRADFDQKYSHGDYSYEDYSVAYRYGATLGSDERFRGRDWNNLEPEARTSWEDRNEGTWDSFKDAVRHGYERVRGVGRERGASPQA